MAAIDRINIEEYKVDLEKFADKIDVELSKVVRKVALDVFSGIIKRTSVDKGVARASWTIGIDKQENVEITVEGGKLTKQAATNIARQQIQKLDKIKPYTTVIISNNVPYIFKLEYGGYPGDGPKTVGGYSTQAPNGMVRVTLLEVNLSLQIKQGK